MKTDIHPKWFPEATVTCSCGKTWTTGATVEHIRTDICSNCHPFYTGEQRIIDTEGARKPTSVKPRARRWACR
jgi:large subunit ribosomal protein L31